MQAPEKPKTLPRRNPVDATLYHQHDPRDKPRKEREEAPYTTRCYFWPIEREAFGQLGAYVNTLADVSAEKPRWLRIVEHANSLADKAGMSREEFYSKALIEFIEKTENLRITEELNEVYKDIDQQEENAFLNRLVRYYDSQLADE